MTTITPATDSLAAFIRQAARPDMAIDTALALRLGVVHADRHGLLYRLANGTPIYAMSNEATLHGARYTSDLNALATLIATRFENWIWRVGRNSMGVYYAEMAHYSGRHFFRTDHKTPALALSLSLAEVLDGELDRTLR